VAGELSAPEETWLSDELQGHLIDLYFEWEQPWFQMLNETLFRESMANSGRYFSPLLLTCILAVGSRYCDRLEVRTDPNDPNTAGRMFICKAEKLIQNDLRWPKITTIQSLAIMGMFYIVSYYKTRISRVPIADFILSRQRVRMQLVGFIKAWPIVLLWIWVSIWIPPFWPGLSPSRPSRSS
jgi:hypothetical protein